MQAQTLANVYVALDSNLEIVPVLNKIDLPSAEPERIRKQIEDVIGIDASMAIPASAKDGRGIPKSWKRWSKWCRRPRAIRRRRCSTDV